MNLAIDSVVTKISDVLVEDTPLLSSLYQEYHDYPIHTVNPGATAADDIVIETGPDGDYKTADDIQYFMLFPGLKEKSS